MNYQIPFVIPNINNYPFSNQNSYHDITFFINKINELEQKINVIEQKLSIIDNNKPQNQEYNNDMYII